jgi:hypothetical protein
MAGFKPGPAGLGIGEGDARAVSQRQGNSEPGGRYLARIEGDEMTTWGKGQSSDRAARWATLGILFIALAANGAYSPAIRAIIGWLIS